MHVEVARLPPEMLTDTEKNPAECSAEVREKVLRARERQFARQGKCNMALTAPEIDHYAAIQKPAQNLLSQVMAKFNLSARAYHRVVKVARTIADLELMR